MPSLAMNLETQNTSSAYNQCSILYNFFNLFYNMFHLKVTDFGGPCWMEHVKKLN